MNCLSVRKTLLYNYLVSAWDKYIFEPFNIVDITFRMAIRPLGDGSCRRQWFKLYIPEGDPSGKKLDQ